MLIDESGLMMMPLVRRSLAPRGCTPVLRHKASHRDRVSICAALCLSPVRQRVSLHFQALPGDYFNNERVAEFLRQLLRSLKGPVIVIWDRGNMHKGDPIRAVCRRFRRLHLEMLPPYAPELNPVEKLWNHLKYTELANYVPKDVPQLHRKVQSLLQSVRNNSQRLNSFYDGSPTNFKRLALET